MIHHMNDIMCALVENTAQRKEDLYFAVTFAWQKLSKNNAEVTPTMGMRLNSVHFLHPFWKLWSFKMWDKGMDITLEDETFYTAH